MLTFKSLGKRGNLGNQLFQIASTVGLAQIFGKEFAFPIWEYSRYFKFESPILNPSIQLKKIIDDKFFFHEWEIEEGNYDINGDLQSEKYFDIQKTKEIFAFKEEFTNPLFEHYNYLFDKKTIFISVRRGDFVNHPHYYQLSYRYYFLALKEVFPDWHERNLIFLSDDINYCKFHFEFLENAFFLENLSPIEQLAISSRGNDFIISNSTFSWWMAWLAERKTSRIVRPLKNFRGKFLKNNDDRDYFPERWIVFDYKKYKMDSKYFTLIIKGEYYKRKEYLKSLMEKFLVLFKKIKNKISK
jgi:hypothetical protein